MNPFSNEWKTPLRIVPTNGKKCVFFSNEWKRGGHTLPTIGKAVCAFLFLVPLAFGADVEQTAQADLDEARAALREQRETIAEERSALSTEYTALQAEVRTLRERWNEVQRATSLRQTEQAALRRRVDASNAEHRQLVAMLTEYRRAAEQWMTVAQRQRYEEALTAIDAALASDEASGTSLQSTEPVLSLLLDLAWRHNGSHWFSGYALDGAGRVRAGRFMEAGPLTYFVGEQGDVAGYIAADQSGREPALSAAMDRRAQDALRQWATNPSVRAPVDVTDGALLKVSAARVSLWERIRQGGVVMLPLGVIGVACVVMIAMRFVALRRMDRDVDSPVTQILERLEAGDENGARDTARALIEPWRDVMLDAVNHWRSDRVYLEEILQDRIVMQRPRVNHYLGALAICAAAAPLLGLLGTVTGMIHTFQLITVFGTGDARSLSGGISEALITTQFGLTIAVPVLLAHAYLARKAKGIMSGMEQAAIRFVRQVAPGEP